ncbi:hypothetical protein ES703_117546 [subsurface metagenome]
MVIVGTMDIAYTIISGVLALYGLYELLFIRIDVPFFMRSLLCGELKFSYRKMEKEAAKISKKVRNSRFRPTIIIGIGGGTSVGGCIFGGILASRKYLDTRFMALDFERPIRDLKLRQYVPDLKSLQHVLGKLEENEHVLITDCTVKRGDTIKNAVAQLEDHGIRRDNIAVAVIVKYSEKLVKKEFDGDSPLLSEDFWKSNFYNYNARTAKMTYPWHF